MSYVLCKSWMHGRIPAKLAENVLCKVHACTCIFMVQAGASVVFCLTLLVVWCNDSGHDAMAL